ncbi:CoA transferase [Intrasporangium oryzae]|uniref:CoA transferase n=1 Tax=Intrasporangium oryzae TaxID=412687 RepID=UPI0004AC8C65|nr:CoA transferase [Intrasporangium oryzae]
MSSRLVDITESLLPVLGPATELPEVAWSGPRTWWAGPLDVEGLAAASVTLASAAATRLAERRGNPVLLGTTADLLAANFGSLDHLRIDGRAPVGFAPLSGYFETADGWVRLHGNYPHHAAALGEALGVGDRDSLAVVLRDLSALDVERRVRAAGGIAGALRRPAAWRTSEPARAVDASPWIAVDLHPRQRPLPAASGSPLSGIRVLDLTRVIAGPTGSRLLALLGADVLRVDPPQLPELLDQHLDTGFGKRSAVADLRDPAVAARLHELLDGADVLLTGYRPGALGGLGLDPASLAERHPDVVHVSLSAWGETGPWGSERGFDSIVQSVTGIGHVYGSSDGTGRFVPGALPVQALDHATGYGMAAAAMAMLASGQAGTASLSLARTAHVLLDAGPLPGATAATLDVDLVTTPSTHGLLVHAPAPVTLDGVSIPQQAPGAYGRADLAWLTPSAS